MAGATDIEWHGLTGFDSETGRALFRVEWVGEINLWLACRLAKSGLVGEALGAYRTEGQAKRACEKASQ